MKLIFRYLKKYGGAVAFAIFIKLIGTLSELLLPYILEYIIDDIVPLRDLKQVLLWGSMMFAVALFCRQFNVFANSRAISNAHQISYEVRQSLFEKTVNLTGDQFDTFTLPSLISRMTSDSYNVQSAVQQFQTLMVRAPILLFGGIGFALVMDREMAKIMIIIMPILILIIFIVSSRGIPMYTAVQEKLDAVVRIMRENITGIRVVKALSKEDYENRRFQKANEAMKKKDVSAAAVMAIPSPLMQMCLNVGLTLVVLTGASRVNQGLMKPGVILAFLTYFNMITMGVMGLNRIFMTLSKASASADRIDAVLQAKTPEPPVQEGKEETESREAVRFDHVSFAYGEGSGSAEDFAGEERENALENISFVLNRGESLGIIGPTGSGKSTIIHLMMRFYEADQGTICVDGQPVEAYDRRKLRRKFGTVFQNDMIFQDTLRENILFGREVDEKDISIAVNSAMAEEFIRSLEDGLEHKAAIKGANLSGGQKQRILVSRALAGKPEILILDDSSSALDYKTDAAMRKKIRENYPDSTLVMIAQRISSVMNLTNILVLDNGRCIGYGTHEELMKACAPYREIYEVQMGAMQE